MNRTWKKEKQVVMQAGGLLLTRRSERRLGNHRVVIDTLGAEKQVNHYYPSGISMTGQWVGGLGGQPYKFGGKELDRFNTLDFYDFEARSYDPALMRFTRPDPLAEKYPGISPWVYCANNPVNRIDPTGMDWYRTNDGMYQFNPDLNKDNQAKILLKGEAYVGATHKDGTGTYRADGSIMFSSEKDAYSRIWNSSQSTGKEEMGVITNDGVLVVPNYKNTPGGVDLADYDYSVKDGNVVDANGKTFNTVATVHTHPSGTGPSAQTGDNADLKFATFSTPFKPVYVLQMKSSGGRISLVVADNRPAITRMASDYNYQVYYITNNYPKGNVDNLLKGNFSLRVFTQINDFRKWLKK